MSVSMWPHDVTVMSCENEMRNASAGRPEMHQRADSVRWLTWVSGWWKECENKGENRKIPDVFLLDFSHVYLSFFLFTLPDSPLHSLTPQPHFSSWNQSVKLVCSTGSPSAPSLSCSEQKRSGEVTPEALACLTLTSTFFAGCFWPLGSSSG